jgi:hypothetical protein
MTDYRVHLQYNSSWKFHQLPDGHVAPVRATGTVRNKAGGTARPSRTKSHLPSHSPPASQAGAVLGQPSSLPPHW